MFLRHLTLVLLLLFPAGEKAAINARSATRLVETAQSQDKTATSRHIKARSKDTLRKISQRLNLPLAELVRLNQVSEDARLPRGMKILVPADAPSSQPEMSKEVVGKRITLSDGYSFEADEVWKDGEDIWYRKGNISQRLPRAISSVTPIVKAPTVKSNDATPVITRAAGVAQSKPAVEVKPQTQVWIYLVGGARFRADEVQETSDGTWYTRGNISAFLGRERIDRIEKETLNAGSAVARNSDWTSGNAEIDQLIKANGARYDLDPYLIFLVIEHESHFRQRAVSPKGARGLMQLMPGTARRLGVRDAFNAAQNINGGSQYLKELLSMFGGRVDLALASYNAGEGAVIKYGRSVPPYRETRDYVKRITKRYGEQENSSAKTGKIPGASTAQ